MSVTTSSARDAFGFSLKGLRTTAAYAAVMTVADDGINEAWDEKFRQAREVRAGEVPGIGPLFGRFWLSRRYRRT